MKALVILDAYRLHEAPRYLFVPRRQRMSELPALAVRAAAAQ